MVLGSAATSETFECHLLDWQSVVLRHDYLHLGFLLLAFQHDTAATLTRGSKAIR